jgi:phosphatidylserine/phosphatidylglycerophosphate/cardiolipin synthase-like enzyme
MTARVRRLLLALVLAGCAPVAGDGTITFPSDEDKADGHDQPPVLPACASPRLEAIFAATRDLVPRGTVPGPLYATSFNHADPVALVDGPEIFPAFRALIASARHHVALQTYVFEPGSDAADDILLGLADLAERRAREAPDGPPVEVRFLFDVSKLGFGSSERALPRAWAQVAALGLDPRHVRFELAGFYHLAFGNLHVKTLVVDGRAAIITGANPQAHHDDGTPWRDSGYRLEGEVALALLADFDGAWRKSKLWLCEGDEDAGGDACLARTDEVAWHVDEPGLPADTCLPMLVTTRQADVSPLSNRTDNTQDQAFLAAFAGARQVIRVQTPNLNDDAARRALLEAVRRGVRVDVILSKGFNDGAERFPGQGGTNEAVVERMLATLTDEGLGDACERLRFRWYSHDGVTAVDGNGPRASHAKYASVDGELAIVGTANMDTQSWNNSREVNVVVDDPATTRAWDERLFLADFARGLPVDACR